ncbi:MAG: hypothetical protein Q4C49_08545 [Bacillota bacterium]|nr:hypothetical protein [Bacillota bacterium]
MRTNQRVQRLLLIQKIQRNPKMSQKLGIQIVSVPLPKKEKSQDETRTKR